MRLFINLNPRGEQGIGERQGELVHSVETQAPKWLFTIVLKMEGGGGLWGDPA